MTLILALLVAALPSSVTATDGASKVLISCALGEANDYVIDVLAKDHAHDTFTVNLRARQHGEVSPLFPDDDSEESVGSFVETRCAGEGEKVLVITGEFLGTGYPRGVVLRYNGGQLQRLEFAERLRPSLLYLGTGEMLLYVPEAYPEREPRWTVYRLDAEHGTDVDREAATRLPAPGKYRSIGLK